MKQRLRDILVTVVVFGMPLLFYFTYTGPYKWISEAQLALIGRYYEKASVLVTLLAWIGLWLLVRVAIQKIRRKPMSFFSNGANQLSHRLLAAVVPVMVAGSLALGGYYYYRYGTTRTPTHVTMEEASRKLWMPGSYLTIDDARFNPDLATAMSDGEDASDADTTEYVPLLPGGYSNGQPVHVFLEIPLSKLGGQPIDRNLQNTGLVSLSGLPGMVRVQFQRKGLPPAFNHLMITYGTTRDDLRIESESYVIVAGIISLIVVVIGAKRRFFKKRPT